MITSQAVQPEGGRVLWLTTSMSFDLQTGVINRQLCLTVQCNLGDLCIDNVCSHTASGMTATRQVVLSYVPHICTMHYTGSAVYRCKLDGIIKFISEGYNAVSEGKLKLLKTVSETVSYKEHGFLQYDQASIVVLSATIGAHCSGSPQRKFSDEHVQEVSTKQRRKKKTEVDYAYRVKTNARLS